MGLKEFMTMIKLTEESFSTTNILVGVVIALMVAYVGSWILKMINTPGPWGLPFLGYYPLLSEQDFYVKLHEMSKKYGDAYMINLVGQDFLYLDSLDAIKEVNVKKAEYFQSRGQKSSFLHDSLEKGIVFLEGEAWKVQRKFFVQAMKEIGLARGSEELGGPIMDSITVTLDALNESRGEPIDIFPLMSKQCTEAVVGLIIGNNVSEEIGKKLIDLYTVLISPISGKRMLLAGDRAKKLYLSRDKSYKDMMASTEEMTNIFKDILKDHRDNFDPDHPPKDFIDSYLTDKANREKKGDPLAKYYTDSSIVPTLIQAYGDGSVSIGLFVGLLYRVLSFKKEAQEELYQDIIKTIGHERLPTWEDRPKLPLVTSVIKETLRNLTVAFIFPGLECSRDTTVMGVPVAKGTMTLMNFWSANNDSRVYKNPEVFDIRRFMPDKTEPDPIIFGIGKRACAGEALVMAELFLFLAAVIQNFVLEPEIGEVEDKNLSFEEFIQKKVRAIPRPGGRYSTEL